MSVMKKQLRKVRQIAEGLRPEKSEVVKQDIVQAEKRLDALKQACLVIHKKLLSCHQGAGQEPLEKRKKRMPEIQLAQCMQECLETHMEGNTLLWQVLERCSVLQTSLGEALLEAQLQAEKEVLASLHDFIEVDVPNVTRMRKQLVKLIQDMDSAKARLDIASGKFTSSHSTQSLSQSSSQAKVEACKEELEELVMKVEQARDTYAAELYALVSREPTICQNLVQWYELQTAFHQRSLELLNSGTPALNQLIEHSNHRPLFGSSLEDHLRCSGREIALVLEACVCTLIETAINEEGLLRIAGSASKVKKIKNALDAGVTDMWEYVTDPHAVAGVLKSYLRALPEPLLTYTAYEDWIQADRIGDSDARLQRLWQVLNSLPKSNYNNLRYLVKFLHCLCKNSDINKMSSQNLSIVIAPNLLWSPASQQSNHIGLNMCAANAHSSIVETLISYCDWFFPDEVSFRLTLAPFLLKGVTTPPVAEEGGSSPTMLKGIVNSAFEGVNGETDDSGQSPRVVHRPGKKPAPPVPQLSQTESDSPPPKPTGPAEFPVGRSATLDRPGKPKRAGTRKSYDNLTSLLNLDSTQQPVAKPAKDSKKEQSSLVSSQVSLTENSRVSEPAEPQATDQSKEHSSAVSDENQPLEEGNLPLATPSVPVLKKTLSQPSSTVPQPVPRREREVMQPKIENTVNIEAGIQPVVRFNKNNGTETLEPEKPLEFGQEDSTKATETSQPILKQLAKEETREPDVPTTGVKDIVRQSSENLSKLNDPVYENLTKKGAGQQSSLLRDGVSHQVSVEKKVPLGDPNAGKSEVEGSLSHPPPSRTPEGHDKPQVPSKPIALLTDSKTVQDLSAQVRPSEKRQPDAVPASAEDPNARGRRAGSGDRWQFLTSGSGPDKAPERPPKVHPPEEAAEGKKPPPSPKVKPPRPQPPAPPLKPKLSTDAEDTRL